MIEAHGGTGSMSGRFLRGHMLFTQSLGEEGGVSMERRKPRHNSEVNTTFAGKAPKKTRTLLFLRELAQGYYLLLLIGSLCILLLVTIMMFV